MVPYYFRNILQNGPKTPKNVQSRETTMSYVSHDMLKYTHNRPKNTLQNAPRQRDKYCKIFLSPLTVRLIEKTTVQNFIR